MQALLCLKIQIWVGPMEKEQFQEIIACLPRGRTVFHYFKDRFAPLLLRYLVGDGVRVSDLKNTRYGALLDRPPVKQALSDYGRGWLGPSLLDLVWAHDTKAFVLTLGGWDGRRSRWGQTSRRGYNLVLQLNFSSEHDRLYRRLVRPLRDAMLNGYGHPVMRQGRRKLFRETLAWARIDLDLECNEALIEEVQSDWVRGATALLRHARARLSGGHGSVAWYGAEGESCAVIDYAERVLAPYHAMWAEAMLAVAIDFIHRELGIDTIYYHEFETGCRVKNIQGQPAPALVVHGAAAAVLFRKDHRGPFVPGGGQGIPAQVPQDRAARVAAAGLAGDGPCPHRVTAMRCIR